VLHSIPATTKFQVRHRLYDGRAEITLDRSGFEYDSDCKSFWYGDLTDDYADNRMYNDVAFQSDDGLSD
jgi:hypothetical protein